jgi:hypothetical protein
MDLLESTGPTSLISGMSLVQGVESYGLGSPMEKTSREFISIPQAYFKAVRRCEPREMNHPTEQLLCRDSVKTVEQLQPSSMALASNNDRWTPCDLRVLETVGNVGLENNTAPRAQLIGRRGHPLVQRNLRTNELGPAELGGAR